MDNKAIATQDKAKEKAPKDNQQSTKDATVLDKEKDKERQPAKEKDTQQAATDVVNSQQGHTAKDCRVAVYNIQEDVYKVVPPSQLSWFISPITRLYGGYIYTSCGL